MFQTIPIDSLRRTVLVFVETYGLVAVFVYMLLETSLALHFVPSEVVVPFAAALLVTGPPSFVAFVLVATAGATVGSVVAYYVFGVNGARALERYGRWVHVSQSDLDRWEGWFHRWGESAVFWGRLLPVVRAFVSVPAGAARMDRGRFVAYTAAGTLLFVLALTALGVSGAHTRLPLALVLGGRPCRGGTSPPVGDRPENGGRRR